MNPIAAALVGFAFFMFVTLYTIALCDMRDLEKKRAFEHVVKTAMNIANRK